MSYKLLFFMVIGPILSAYSTLGGSTNMRMRVTTRDYCNRDLLDASGNPAPCGISQSMETYGLTLPGMDDGILTTREDIFIANDGQVSVKAMPNYPYQYTMTVNSGGLERVEQLYNHQSYLVSEAPDTTFVIDSSTGAASTADLVKQGWVPQETNDSGDTGISTFSLKGPEGVHPVDGTNHTAVYLTGIMPDTWVLYFNESSQKPVKLLAINTYVGGRIFHESTFEEIEYLEPGMTVEGATKVAYDIYRVDGQRRLEEVDENTPLMLPDYIAGDFLPERSRAFFDDHEPVDWMIDHRSLRQGDMFHGIDYFTIEKRSAADIYFHALSSRQLARIARFEYPNGCRSTTTNKFCLYAEVDFVFEGPVTVKVSVVLTEPAQPGYGAYLSLLVTLRDETEAEVLDLAFKADGCALVFQYGEGASISIDVCLYGEGSGTDLLQPDRRTFYGEATLTAVFRVKLPEVSSFDWTIRAEMKCTAKPYNEISAYGRVTAGTVRKVASAYIGVTLYGNTVDNTANKWEFVSYVIFKAHVGIWKTKKTWDRSWLLWRAGPVLF